MHVWRGLAVPQVPELMREASELIVSSARPRLAQLVELTEQDSMQSGCACRVADRAAPGRRANAWRSVRIRMRRHPTLIKQIEGVFEEYP